METIVELYGLAKAHAWQALLIHLALALILLVTAKRSQIDAWAESKPRLAGVLKILRGVGLDPFLILQGVSLILRGRLPPPPSDKKPDSAKGTRIIFPVLAALSLMTAFSFLTACATVKDVVWPTVAKCAPAPKQIVADVINVLKDDPGGSLTDRGMNLLEELARKHGESVIACAIADVADRMSGTDDPNELRMRAKAKDFFEATQVVTE